MIRKVTLAALPNVGQRCHMLSTEHPGLVPKGMKILSFRTPIVSCGML